MNPQDVSTNADRIRVRDDYLAVLRQQEANLQKTANAMSVMVQTGQPPIAPSDMRTATEKLGDIERLKPMFRKQLASLMELKEVEVVMNVLDNAEIQAAVMIFGEITSQLKGKYPLGIPAPIFVEFLRRFLRDYDKSIGFLPKSRQEQEEIDLNPADALGSTRRYMEEQQQQLDEEMEGTRLAQDIRNEESRNQIAENQMMEKYYEAFDIASPAEIREVAQNLLGNRKGTPSAKNLKVAKRILGFDKLTPEEIFKYTSPTVGELISYLEYDYFRNFGTLFTNAERGDLGRMDIGELFDIFSRLRGGENLAGGDNVADLPLPQTIRTRELSMMGSEDFPAQSSLSGVLSRRRRLAEPRVEEQVEEQLELGPNATVAEITEAVKRRGRPAKYASKEEARLAKLEQTRQSKQRTKLSKEVTAEIEALTQQAINDVLIAFNKSGKTKQDRRDFDRAMGDIQRGKQLYIDMKLQELGLPISSPVKASKIPAFSGAAEFQGLQSVELPESAVSTPIKSESSSIPVPTYMMMSPQLFRELGYLDKVDLMDRFTRTELFDSIDPELQRNIRDLIGYAETPSAGAPVTQDEALQNLEIAFELVRNGAVRTITGEGFMGKVKSKATGAAKHTKNLIIGRGLSKPKREFADKIDTSISTLPENKSYVPFGKYVLNRRRLNDNKLMVRTVKGGAISGIPTLSISPVLGGIIKKMVGGALPSYNEMSNLSEEEQNTLYKIFKISEVDNADLLPAPNKTKEEEEMNRFQILKGQVLAGNDNKELIKEFKVMLLKFIHNGKVPRGQGMEIICDLMAMGY